MLACGRYTDVYTLRRKWGQVEAEGNQTPDQWTPRSEGTVEPIAVDKSKDKEFERVIRNLINSPPKPRKKEESQKKSDEEGSARKERDR